MSEPLLTPFPCNACGKCCRRVSASTETAFLDRGDGVCHHFVEGTHLCAIYTTRPLVCRVEEYYRAKLADVLSWDEFVRLNIAICEKL
ncbi:YkgJ family cysteine cluster protein [Providencia manganoxydans]|uniref:YkgJ family cysteine cluster protein n=1 Tax=Morganellaceae TaxID=1903414 RepID=UPI00128F04D6|nr:YkgJ family cysteine cluster protein [Providencia rettgeri]QFV07574.1 YkgJ family cysteine cluster protein [Proteus mirabilis]